MQLKKNYLLTSFLLIVVLTGCPPIDDNYFFPDYSLNPKTTTDSANSATSSDAIKTITGSDGAKVLLPENFTGSAEIKKTTEAKGEKEGDLVSVSGEYQITFKNIGSNSYKIPVTIPIEDKFLPKDFEDAQIQPEYFDSVKGEWIMQPSFIYYDSKAKTVSFETSTPLLPKITYSDEFSTLAETDYIRAYRIRVYYISSMLSVKRDDSDFIINYFPSSLGKNYSVIKDSEWNSNTGNSQDPEIPDYVEDFDHALNQSYQKILNLKDSNDKNVFSKLSTPQNTYVEDTGPDAGSSNLGGPLKISCKKAENYNDMSLTSAHELIHVFQGQYYTASGLFTGRLNRWFIEATANYYATVVNNLDDEAKKTFYNDFYADYLSESILSSNDNSMYALGHFLDWLSLTYNPNIVGDTLLTGRGNDLAGLSDSIKLHGGKEIGTAFEEFGKYLITHPDDYAGFNSDVKTAMGNHSIGNGFLKGSMFNDKRTYITLNKPCTPLSMTYASLSASNSSDSLLVIDSSESAGSLIKSYTYDFSGSSNADYKNKIPIDSYYFIPSKTTLSIPNFSKAGKKKSIEQLIINASSASKSNLKISYYLLQTPKVLSVSTGEVTWDTSGIGNIPQDFIKGYSVFKSTGEPVGSAALETGEVINKIIPLEKGKISQNFKHSSIKANDNIIVVVIDKYNNKWPQIIQKAPAEPSITANPSFINMLRGQTKIITVDIKGFENKDFTVEILNNGLFKDADMGNVSKSGNTITYTAPSEVTKLMGTGIIIKSVADPTKFIQVTIYVWQEKEYMPT